MDRHPGACAASRGASVCRPPTTALLVAALALALAIGACGKSRTEEAAPEQPASGGGEGAAAAPAPAPAAATPDASEPERPPMKITVEVAEPLPEVGERSKDEDAAPGADACAKACANALKVSMAGLPADASAQMREAIERRLREDCPTHCTERATPRSVRCVQEARTTDDLSRCVFAPGDDDAASKRGEPEGTAPAPPSGADAAAAPDAAPAAKPDAGPGSAP